jgi:monoamine oxidase
MTSPYESTIVDILIVGGGLSGLRVAYGIQEQLPLVDWKLLEATSTLGGRLRNDTTFHQIDLGGAWIWPTYQPSIRDLVHNLHIATFPQPDDPSSTRIDGGAIQIIHMLTKRLQESKIHLNTAVMSCQLLETSPRTHLPDESMIRVTTSNQDEQFLARVVVFAVPPKIITKYVIFDPPLSLTKQAAMMASPTWMAGVTKVALVYPQRFWDVNTSNTILSATPGPAFQVYDSSTSNGKLIALTFFALVTDHDEMHHDTILVQHIADQLAHHWEYHHHRPDLACHVHSYTNYHIHRWPNEPYISDNDHPVRIHSHPSPIRALSESEWKDQLLFAGTETDSISPGVMEGAVHAAECVIQTILTTFSFRESENI